MVNVVIADGHFLSRFALKQILSNRDQYRIIAEAFSKASLIKLLAKSQVDVVVIDPSQERYFGKEILSEIALKFPDTKVLIISADQSKAHIYKILDDGYATVITKECDSIEIIESLEALLNDEKYFCKKISNLIWEKSFGKQTDCSGSPLTQREIEIVQMVVSGMISKEIALELKLSPHTVYTHRKNILKKLALSTTPELVLYAVKNGLIQDGEA